MDFTDFIFFLFCLVCHITNMDRRLPTYTASLLDSDEEREPPPPPPPPPPPLAQSAHGRLKAHAATTASSRRRARQKVGASPYHRARRGSTALRESVDSLVQRALGLQDQGDYIAARAVINQIDALQRQAAAAARQHQPRSKRPQRASLVLDQVHATRMAMAVRSSVGTAEGGKCSPSLRVADEEGIEDLEDSDDDDDASYHGYSQMDDPALQQRLNALELSDSDVLLLVAPPVKQGVLRTLEKTPPRAQHKSHGDGDSIPSPPSPHTPPVAVMVTKEGLMQKSPPLLSSFARWRKRWFVLSGKLLVYCKKQDSKVPKGMIELTGATLKAVNSTSGPTQWEVRIYAVTPAPRTYRLSVATEEECISWYTAIENNISVATSEQRRASQVLLPKPSSSAAKSVEAESGTARRRSRVGVDISVVPENAKQRTFYEILGTSSTATPEMIKKEYYKLARNFHPDKNPHADPAAFAEINRAFQCLKDLELRADYDLRERVKCALRIGVLVVARGDDPALAGGGPRALFLDYKLDFLYLQAPELGLVLGPNYCQVEMRWVQAVVAGSSINNDLSLTLVGEKMPHGAVELEFDTPESRDELMDGLRVLRCERSQLFTTKLEEMLAEGLR